MKNLLVLLSTTTDTVNFQYIFGIVVLVVVAASVVVAVYNHLKSNKTEEELKVFLKSIQSIVQTETINFITELNFKNIAMANHGSLTIAEAIMIERIYDRIYDVCEEQLDQEYADNPIYIFLKKALTRDAIQDFMDGILANQKIHDMLCKKIEDHINDSNQDETAMALEAEQEQINYEAENEDPDEEVDEISPEEAAGAMDIELIPPTDEAEDDFEEGTEVVGEETVVEDPLDKFLSETAEDTED